MKPCKLQTIKPPNTIEQYCEIYLLLLQKFRLLALLLSYDLDNIDLQVKMLMLHYEIKECRRQMRKRLRLD